MIKKLLLILCALALCSSSFAGSDDIKKKVIARINATDADAACPSFYNSTNVLFSFEAGKDGSNPEDGCDSGGNQITGAITGGDIGTYGGSTAFRIDADDEYIFFNDAINIDYDGLPSTSGKYTMCMSLYIDADLTDTVSVAVITPAGQAIATNDNKVVMYLSSQEKPTALVYFSTTQDSANDATAVSIDDWYIIGIQWLFPYDTGRLATYESVGANWDFEYDMGFGTPDANGVDLYIGNYLSAPGGQVYVRKYALMTGSGTACPF